MKMPRRPASKQDLTSAKDADTVSDSSLPNEFIQAEAAQSRIDRLVALLDHCTQAKETADVIGEKFLSYLLAMAIQESRSAMRQQPSFDQMNRP